MNVSMNWISDYVDLSGLDREELIHRFTLSTAEVEDVYHLGTEINGVVVAEITKIEEHPNSKKLHLLELNLGDHTDRCACGAPNVRVGMRVPFAPFGASVKGMTIGEATIAGVVSRGMCCSAQELGIADSSSGLLELPKDAPLGKDVKELYPIEDIVFEPEVGALYYGKVVRVISNLGAFVELVPGKDAMCHIKDLEFKRTEKVEDVLKVGDMTWVKVMNIGPRGIDLSRKDALRERGEA